MAERLTRTFLSGPVTEVAPALLGCTVLHRTGEGTVAVRLTEVEAYAGQDDPASHAWRGPTPRTRVMFGPAGHLYLYLAYGMHWCANIVTGPDGTASAVLLRGGEVTARADLAAARRRLPVGDPRTARGPAGLATALGLTRSDNGSDVLTEPFALLRSEPPVETVVAGPRVGITRAADVPWRFHLAGAVGVSPFRPGRLPRR